MIGVLQQVLWFKWPLAMIVALGLVVAPEVTPASDNGAESSAFFIKKAEWRFEDSELRVEGEGLNAETVTVLNALDLGQVLGSSDVKDGKWKVRLSEPPPSPVPCRVRAVHSDGTVAEEYVNNAPSDCAPGSNPDAREFSIKKAEWRPQDAELRVEGEGPNGEIVTVSNAYDLSQVMGSSYAKDGKWKVRLNAPPLNPVPCRIHAEHADGKVQERDVKDAPADCAPQAPDQGGNQAPNGIIDSPQEASVTIHEGESVTFAGTGTDPDGDPLTFLWTFDGGAQSSTQEDPGSVTFSTPGTYTVSFAATDDKGLPDPTPDMRTIQVVAEEEQPPLCDIVSPAGDLTVSLGDTVSYAGTASDPANAPLTLSWTFPGGTPASSTALVPGDVAYNSAGTFTATFQATNDADLSCPPVTRTITVQEAAEDGPPVCTIDAPTALTTSTGIGGTVNFAATVVDEDPAGLSFLWDFGGGAPNVTVEDPGVVAFNTAGSFTVTFTATDAALQTCIGQVRIVEVTDTAAQLPPPVTPVANDGLLGTDFPGHVVLGANDLGMHCADQDDRIFSVLPPLNVLHAQVVERGTNGNLPRVLSDAEVSVAYSAASSASDPAGAGSINSTSDNFPVDGTDVPQVYKGNFWDADVDSGNPIGFDVYAPLFFGLLTDPTALPQDLGLPVPESSLLWGCLPPPFAGGDGDCGFAQQAMPGIANPYVANEPQLMHFDTNVGFFNDLLGGVAGINGKPLGSVITNANWFRADGIPMLPVDDQGRSNAYPLVRVQALQGGSPVASTDVVLPVASEADCQGCHLDPNALCTSLGLTCEGQAASFASQPFTVVDLDDATELATTAGDNDEQKVLNGAKINILRLHDAKHGTTLDTTQNTPPTNPKVVCASCHYSPATDLAQVGPTDTPADTAGTGLPGTEQTQHISMSRAMHGHHGELEFGGQKLFPDMPPPDQRNIGDALPILEDTCYQCHPGKRTKCLRGAMGGSGIVCQDCHGNMTQVGDDFTAGFPNNPGNGDFTKRVSWASEPKCMSCHTGDAANPNHPAGSIVAPDGIRLLQAYTAAEHIDQGGNATPIVSISSRFAENESLFRLSGNGDGSGKGHGGLMCEGCHGSTHAIWPNANPNANDNIAADQLQGHTGTLLECSTCHDQTTLDSLIENGQALDGPHGMHPVNAPKWIKGGGIWHGKVAKDENGKPNGGACGACHGPDHKGTVLSRAPVDRILKDEDGKTRATVQAGDIIACDLCHDLKKSFGQ